jgi:competence protein ComEA
MEEGDAKDFLSKFKIPLALTIVGSVLLIGGVFSSNILSQTFSKTSTKSNSSSSPRVSSTSSPSNIKVDVSGAVLNPGVYSLSSEDRVEDAIKLAGGVSETVDKDYLSKRIDLAQKLSDGMKVYIPHIGEVSIPSSGGSVAGVTNQSGSSLINVNTASSSELDQLPGVGAVTAQKIIDNRPYNDLSELINKKAVTKGTLDKIKDLISI